MTNIWQEFIDMKKRLPIGQRVILTEPRNWVCLLPEIYRGLEGEVIAHSLKDPNRYYHQYIEVTVLLDAGMSRIQCHPSFVHAI